MKKSPKTRPVALLQRSTCPLANALDLVGDKWTLLVVRDMLFLQKHRYGEFLESAEGIPTNILADRLKRLEGYGLIEKKPYQFNPVRYEYQLTPRGRDLEPALHALVAWGINHIPGVDREP